MFLKKPFKIYVFLYTFKILKYTTTSEFIL